MTLPDGATVTDRLLAPPNMLLNIDIVRKIASGRRQNVENSTKVKSYIKCLDILPRLKHVGFPAYLL